MTYVDPQIDCLPNRNWKWNVVTHLFADTEKELHAFAASIGLKRSWFQRSRTCDHYDLTPGKRMYALRAGAVSLSTKDAVAKWQELRKSRASQV